MKRFLLLICCCLIGGAAASGEEPRGAELWLAETNHDFGDVPRKGGDLVYDFVFTNGGDAPLVVTRVVTTCSCIRASYPRRPVAPGGTGTIRVTYQPLKSDPGAFNKVLRIYSNASSGCDVITVQGNSLDGGRSRKIRSEKVKPKTK